MAGEFDGYGDQKPGDKQRRIVGYDNWDEPIHNEVPKQKKPKHHTRRLTGRKRVVATAAALTLIGGGGLAAKALFGEDEAPKSPTVSVTTPQHEQQPQPSTPEDPEVSFLQREYTESQAKLETDQPFAIGLSEEELQRLDTLNRKLYDESNSIDINDAEFRELLALKQRQNMVAQDETYTQGLIEQYDAAFLGKTSLSSGHRVNIYQVASQSGKKVEMDPKAFDAWEQWAIDKLDDVYEDEGREKPNKTDLERRQKIKAFQELAHTGKLDSTITLLVNPDQEECFTKEDDIVANTSDQCHALGFANSSHYSSVVGLNSVRVLDTRSTYKDPDAKNNFLWGEGAGATNAAFLHEVVGHISANEADLFSTARDKKLADHAHLTIPLTNLILRVEDAHKTTPGKLPRPLTIS